MQSGVVILPCIPCLFSEFSLVESYALINSSHIKLTFSTLFKKSDAENSILRDAFKIGKKIVEFSSIWKDLKKSTCFLF